MLHSVHVRMTFLLIYTFSCLFTKLFNLIFFSVLFFYVRERESPASTHSCKGITCCDIIGSDPRIACEFVFTNKGGIDICKKNGCNLIDDLIRSKLNFLNKSIKGLLVDNSAVEQCYLNCPDVLETNNK